MKGILKYIRLLTLLFSLFIYTSCENIINSNNNNTNDNSDLIEEISTEYYPIDYLDLYELDLDYIETLVLSEKLDKNLGESIEIDVIEINDQVIEIMHSELINYYGDVIDVDALLKDILITSAIIIVEVACIALAAYTGGSSTVAGNATASILIGLKKTADVVGVVGKGALISTIVGSAIDGSIAAAEAIKEGGDLAYVLGHALNGVVDGVKWSALFTPFVYAAQGIKQVINARKLLGKIIGKGLFDNIVPNLLGKTKIGDVILNSIKNADEIFKLVDNKILPKEVIYSEIAQIFTGTADNIGKEIFDIFSKNRLEIFELIRKYDPFNNLADVTKTLQKTFLKTTDEKAFNTLRTGLAKKTIKSLDDEPIKIYKEIIINNLDEFKTIFKGLIGDDLRKNIIQKTILETYTNFNDIQSKLFVDTFYDSIKRNGSVVYFLDNIKSNSAFDKKIVDLNFINSFVYNHSVFSFFTENISTKRIETFLSELNLFENISVYANQKDDILLNVIKKIKNGDYKTIESMFKDLKPNTTPSKNKMIGINYTNLKNSLENLNLSSKNKELLQSYIKLDLSYNYSVSDEVIEKIFNNTSSLTGEEKIFIESFINNQNCDLFTYLKDLDKNSFAKEIIEITFNKRNITLDVQEQLLIGSLSDTLLSPEEYLKLYKPLEFIASSLNTTHLENFYQQMQIFANKYIDKIIDEGTEFSSYAITTKMLSEIEDFDTIRKVVNLCLDYDAKTETGGIILNKCLQTLDFLETLSLDGSKNVAITTNEMSNILNALASGTIVNLDDVSKYLSADSFKIFEKNLNYAEILIYQSQNVIDDAYRTQFINLVKITSLSSQCSDVINNSTSFFTDIIENSLTKNDIISKYGIDNYNSLVMKSSQINSKLSTEASGSLLELANDISKDALRNDLLNNSFNIQSYSLETFFQSNSLSTIDNLTDKIVIDNYSSFFNYAKTLENQDTLINQLVNVRSNYWDSLNIDAKPINYNLSGQSFVDEFTNKTVSYTNKGHVVFDKCAIASITMELTGESSYDIARANTLFFGNSSGLSGYTWHHLEDGKSMILIPTKTHQTFRHTGGASYLRNYESILIR